MSQGLHGETVFIVKYKFSKALISEKAYEKHKHGNRFEASTNIQEVLSIEIPIYYGLYIVDFLFYCRYFEEPRSCT